MRLQSQSPCNTQHTQHRVVSSSSPRAHGCTHGHKFKLVNSLVNSSCCSAVRCALGGSGVCDRRGAMCKQHILGCAQPTCICTNVVWITLHLQQHTWLCPVAPVPFLQHVCGAVHTCWMVGGMQGVLGTAGALTAYCVRLPLQCFRAAC